MLSVFSLEVAASTGHSVTLVDMTDDILKKAMKGIQTSLRRVVKKTFSDDPEVRRCRSSEEETEAMSVSQRTSWFLLSLATNSSRR